MKRPLRFFRAAPFRVAARGILSVLIGMALLSCGTGTDGGPPDNGGASGSGGGQALPPCSGSATPCSLLSGLSCASASGCTLDEQCTGVATSCSLLFTSVTCQAQDGCTWNTTQARCSGVETACLLESLRYTCEQQDGCHWQSDCSGIPTSCSVLGPAACARQPGCVGGGTVDVDAGVPVEVDAGVPDALVAPDSSPVLDSGGPSVSPDASNGCSSAFVSSCRCSSNADCAPYQDPNLCNARLVCQQGACTADPSTAVQCQPSTIPCSTMQCVPSTGACVLTHEFDGAYCNDGRYCTTNDSCQGGQCVGQGSPCSLSCETCNESTKTCAPSAGSCVIDQECWSEGAPNPANSCQACSAASPTAWTAAAVGATCTTGNACSVDGKCDATAKCVGVPVVPPVPAVRSPMSGARTGSVLAPSTFAVRRPLFAWSEPADPCFDPIAYDVQVDDSCPATGFSSCAFPSPEASVTGVAATQWRPTADLPVSTTPPVGTRYYWRVRACRGGVQCSAWSAVHYVDVGRAERDFDGDGYSDAAYGSSYSNSASSPYPRGRVYVFRGHASGAWTSSGALEQPDMVDSYSLGQELASGDVNGDGFADLAVSSVFQNAMGVRTYLYVFHGSAAGLGPAPALRIDETMPVADTGTVMTMAGDLDADGYDDLVTRISGGISDMAHGFRGSPSGLSSTVAFTIPMGPQANGFALAASHTDVNGDAIADLVIRNEPGVAAWWGAFSPASIWPATPSASATVMTANTNSTSLATGGDIDGDGIDDIATASFVFQANSPVGTLALLSFPSFGTTFTTRWTLQSPLPGSSNFGNAVAIDGDINGDGHADVVLGVLDSTGMHGEGVVYAGPSALAPAAPTYTLPALDPGDFGYVARTFGDMNGDGYGDVMFVAATSAPTQYLPYLCLGGTDGLTPARCAAVANPDASMTYFGGLWAH